MESVSGLRNLLQGRNDLNLVVGASRQAIAKAARRIGAAKTSKKNLGAGSTRIGTEDLEFRFGPIDRSAIEILPILPLVSSPSGKEGHRRPTIDESS
jgi:hypothetical protein